ncbi:hypothetical protein Enr13x_57200 [Stieleria neptunia]|uniref:Uncharacterized protein n=1 Tax=Stieleria neptunia TaxID=2527979 RepID=A0A518HYH0_9BACT|nr:hypothetical protein [Stieleria neptunia]QDV45817.1 hypothetical protein Enr13x_57200 [Stieleria neptunia]
MPEKDFGRYSRKRDMLSVEVSPKMTDRALRIMDALVKRIFAIGGAVEIRLCRNDRERRATTIVIAGVDVTTIRLREKREKVVSENDDLSGRSREIRVDLVSTGVLLFDRGPGSLETELLIDEGPKKVEDGLNDLIIRLIKHAGETRLKENERQERLARWEARQQMEGTQEKVIKYRIGNFYEQQALERERVNELFNDADAYQQAQKIRVFVDALSECMSTEDGTVAIDSDEADYLRWAHQLADRVDPLCESPPSILDDGFNVAEIGPKRPR